MNGYDRIIVGVSGGKDSTAVLLWLINESGVDLGKVLAVFNDTNNEDSLTYDYLAMLSERVWPIMTIFPELDFWELAARRKRFPSRRARFCTQQLKVIPSQRFETGLRAAGCRVLRVDGVRREEGHSGNTRGQVHEFETDEVTGVDVWHPLHDAFMDRVWELHRRHLDLDDVIWLVREDKQLSDEHKAEIIDKMRERGIPANPLYYMGAKRVGCFPCINSNKLEVRALAKYRPERIDFIREREEEDVGNAGYSSFFNRKIVPLRWRSRPIVTTAGETMMVATIDDVVAWAQTSWGANQLEFDWGAFDEDRGVFACDLRGRCE